MYILTSIILCFLTVPEVGPANVSGGDGSRSELVITWEVSSKCHFYIFFASLIFQDNFELKVLIAGHNMQVKQKHWTKITIDLTQFHMEIAQIMTQPSHNFHDVLPMQRWNVYKFLEGQRISYKPRKQLYCS